MPAERQKPSPASRLRSTARRTRVLPVKRGQGSVGRAGQGGQNPCCLIMVWTTDKKQIDNKKLYILLARLLDHAPPRVAY